MIGRRGFITGLCVAILMLGLAYADRISRYGWGWVWQPFVDIAAQRPEQVYVFHLPVQFMGCLEYRPQSGETFESWHIQQPMTIDLRGTSNVTISNTLYDSIGCTFSPWVDAR